MESIIKSIDFKRQIKEKLINMNWSCFCLFVLVDPCFFVSVMELNMRAILIHKDKSSLVSALSSLVVSSLRSRSCRRSGEQMQIKDTCWFRVLKSCCSNCQCSKKLDRPNRAFSGCHRTPDKWARSASQRQFSSQRCRSLFSRIWFEKFINNVSIRWMVSINW